MIEHFLRRDFDLFDQSSKPYWEGVIGAGVPDKERNNLLDYLKSIEGYRDNVLAIESEFTLGVIEGAWPLRGHIDLMTWWPDGTIIIHDHKTNRQYEGVEVWSKKIQQIAYAWAVRKMLPNVERVAFEIGYVNQGSKVQWLTQPTDDVWFENQFAQAWQEFSVYLRRNEWPERLNSNCGWCPLQVSCPIFRSSMEALLPSAAQSPSPAFSPERSLSSRVIWLETALKAGTQLLDSLKQQLLELAKTSGGEYTEEGNVIRLTYSSRRKTDERVAWSTLLELLNEYPELSPQWEEVCEEVLTFKVTGLDKLVKKCEAFRPLVDRAVQKVTSDEPTVRVIPGGQAPEK